MHGRLWHGIAYPMITNHVTQEKKVYCESHQFTVILICSHAYSRSALLAESHVLPIHIILSSLLTDNILLFAKEVKYGHNARKIMILNVSPMPF